MGRLRSVSFRFRRIDRSCCDAYHAILFRLDPFPWALNEAFDLYRLLAESNGRVIGLTSGRPISIILTGDSA